VTCNTYTVKECVISFKKEKTEKKRNYGFVILYQLKCLCCALFDISEVHIFFSQQGTTKVVFAFHTEDPESDDDIARHTFRGSRSILLLNKMDERQVNETGWKTFLMHNKNVRWLESFIV